MNDKQRARLQAKARSLFEMESMSHRDIASTLKIAPRTVLNWAERGLPNPLAGQWIKGQHAAKVMQKVEESILDLAKARGLDYGYFLDKVKLLCEATRPVLVKGENETEAKKEGDESGGGFVTEVPDFKTIDAGLTHAERIIPGLKAAETLQHNFPAEMLAFFQDQA